MKTRATYDIREKVLFDIVFKNESGMMDIGITRFPRITVMKESMTRLEFAPSISL